MQLKIFILLFALVANTTFANEPAQPSNKTPENAARFIALALADGRAKFQNDETRGLISSITSQETCKFNISFGDGGRAFVDMSKISAIKLYVSSNNVELHDFGRLGYLDLFVSSSDRATRLSEAFLFLQKHCNPAENLGF